MIYHKILTKTMMLFANFSYGVKYKASRIVIMRILLYRLGSYRNEDVFSFAEFPNSSISCIEFRGALHTLKQIMYVHGDGQCVY